jgi:uncharacterized protein (DUF983 family)
MRCPHCHCRALHRLSGDVLMCVECELTFSEADAWDAYYQHGIGIVGFALATLGIVLSVVLIRLVF